MSKEKHNDKLEEYFRKSFEGQGGTPFEDGWDTPSDGVWDGIIDEIKGGRKTGLFFQDWRFWAIAVVLLTGALIYQAYQHKSDFEEMNQQVLENVAMIEALKKELKEERKKDEDPNPPSTQNADNQYITNTIAEKNESEFAKSQKNIAIKSTRKKEQNSIVPPTNSSQQKVTISKNLDKVAFPDKKNEEQVAENISIESYNEVESTSVPSAENTSIEFFSLPTKANLVESSSNSDLKLNTLKESINLSSRNAYNKWSIQSYIGIIYSNRILRNKETNRVKDFGLSPKNHFSYSTGLDVNFQLNKNWSVFTGLNYQNLNMASNHKIGFRYSEIDAVINQNNNPERDYEVQLSSEYGNIDIELRAENELQNDGFDYNEGTPIRAEVTVLQHLDYLGLPVGLRYKLNAGKWSFGLKGAIVPSFLIADEINVEAISFAENRLVLKKANLKSNKVSKLLPSFVLNTQAGLGIDYQISPKIKLAFEPTFQANLTPYLERPKRAVRIYSMEFRAGMAYAF